MARDNGPSGLCGISGEHAGMTVIPLRTSRRSRASPRRRAPEIIEAAARIFAERGFHGTSMDALAQALGVQKGSLYSLIGSKQERLRERQAIALAVLRLMTSSNLVGCSMGRSPGLAPLRMRST